MCPVGAWEAAKKSGQAYFPPTFEKDGYFTHATSIASTLIGTANHFYQDAPGDWLCLVISRSALLKECGVVTKDEPAAAVGDTDAADKAVLFPHIYGGISPRVVREELDIIRAAGKFISIKGLERD